MIEKKDLKKFLKNQFLLNKTFLNLVVSKEKLYSKVIRKNIIQKSFFTDCKINYFEFWRVVFKKVVFKNCEFKNSLFCDLDLKNCTFINCKFINVNFSHVKINPRIFVSCIFSKIDTNNILLKGKTGLNIKINIKNYSSIFILNKFFYKLKNNSIGKITDNITKNNLVRFNIFELKNFYFKKQEFYFHNETPVKIKKINSFPNKNIIQLQKNTPMDELISGKGYIVLKNIFSKSDLEKAKKIILNLKLRHNYGQFDKRNKQYYYHNLFSSDPVFSKFLPKKKYMNIFRKILGKQFQCGFYSANVSMPGGRGQLFHFDHPYPIIETINTSPKNISFKTPINMQSLVFLTDVNEENGPTSFVPYSQLLQTNPSYLKIKVDELNKKIFFNKNKKNYSLNYIDLKGSSGTMVIFNGLAWHRGGYNYSKNQNRITLLGQWIPNYVVPMHNFQINSKTPKSVYKYIDKRQFPVKV